MRSAPPRLVPFAVSQSRRATSQPTQDNTVTAADAIMTPFSAGAATFLILPPTQCAALPVTLAVRCLAAAAVCRTADRHREKTLPTSASLTDQGRAVLAAVAAGELAPSQGAALIGALGTMAKIHEVDELERRIAALEGNHGNGA